MTKLCMAKPGLELFCRVCYACHEDRTFLWCAFAGYLAHALHTLIRGLGLISLNAILMSVMGASGAGPGPDRWKEPPGRA